MAGMISEIELKGQAAKAAALQAAVLPAQVRERVLQAMADSLDLQRDAIKEANQVDMQAAEEENLSDAIKDRLLLTDERIDDMIKGLRDIAAMPDVVGNITKMWKRPNDLLV